MYQASTLPKQANELFNQIQTHPVFEKIKSTRDLKTLMEMQIFIEWSLMPLTRSLQVDKHEPENFISKLDSESLQSLIQSLYGLTMLSSSKGSAYTSRFEDALNVMEEIGANTDHIKNFLRCINKAYTIEEAIERAYTSSVIKDFMRHNLKVLAEGDTEKIKALVNTSSLLFEASKMKASISRVENRSGQKLKKLRRYFQDWHNGNKKNGASTSEVEQLKLNYLDGLNQCIINKRSAALML